MWGCQVLGKGKETRHFILLTDIQRWLLCFPVPVTWAGWEWNISGAEINSQTSKGLWRQMWTPGMDQACRATEVQEFLMAAFTHHMGQGSPNASSCLQPLTQRSRFTTCKMWLLLVQDIRGCTKHYCSSIRFCRKVKKILNSIATTTDKVQKPMMESSSEHEE